MSWLDALLGKVRSGGVDIPLSKGINFTNGLAATLNQTTKMVDVSTVPSAPDAAVLAPLLRGVGLTVDSAFRLRVRPRPRVVSLRDPFLTGPAVSAATQGILGLLGWSLTAGAGTPSFTRASRALVTTIGCGLVTGTSINDNSALHLGSTATQGVLVASEVALLQSITRINSLATNRTFFGASADLTQEPSAMTDGIGIYYDSAVSPNYQIIVRAGGVGSPIVSSLPATTVATIFTVHQPTPGQFRFYAGNTLLGTISAGVPTVSLNVGFRAQTLAASAATYRVFDFLFESVDLGGAWDDDDFLEA